jgi:hypothetical protein
MGDRLGMQLTGGLSDKFRVSKVGRLVTLPCPRVLLIPRF